MTVIVTACSTPVDRKGDVSAGFIGEAIVNDGIERVIASQPASDRDLLARGVKHAASLWRGSDGTTDDFLDFVDASYVADPEKRRSIFLKLSNYFE